MLILLLLFILLAYYVQRKVYEHFWDKNLDIDVRFEQPYVYEGDSCALIEEISNDKWMPLTAVEVRLGVSRNLEFSGDALENSNVSDQSYRRDVFALFSHMKIIRTLPFQCRRRGFYQITRSEVVGSDFFFRRETHGQVPQQTQLFVYPRAVDISRIRLLCRTISGSVVRQNRLYPDSFEFSGIREYRNTDPMNQINWKASARMGEMMVNQFDSTTSIWLTILLDTMDAGILKYTELIEEGIRITASLAAELDRKQMDVKVKGNGICNFPGKKEVLSASLKAGAQQMAELNRKLAVLDSGEPCEEFSDVCKREALEKKQEQIYVVISRDEHLAQSGCLTELSGQQNQVIWIYPYLRQINPIIPKVKGITVFGWEVER